MFDKTKALNAVEFMGNLHLTDDFYGQPFVLQNWQHDILWDVYGTVKENGFRQYRFAYLEIPKKNGKTTMIAGIALYHLVCDPPGGQIYCCAADREQASLVYHAALQMIDQDDYLSEHLKVTDSKKLITNPETGTFIKVLSAEAFTKHGINPTVVIFDELHAQPNRELWDVMTFGSGSARREPLYWVITTAGDDPDRNSVGWEQHEYALKIQDGEIIDPYWYVKIYGAPEDADIFNEKTWYAANPSLGVSIDIEALRQEIILVRNKESAERLFRWLRLNQWVANKTTSWLPLTLWDANAEDIPLEKLIGLRCYCGLDLSSVGDLTGSAYLFPPQDGLDFYYVLFDGWIPLDNMKEREKMDKVPYAKWLKQGFVSATPGDVIDYDFIKARLIQINDLYDMEAWGNDTYGAEKLRQDLLRDADIELMEVRQDIAHTSPTGKEIERLLKLGLLKHNKNPLARWNFGNVRCITDGNDNYKFKKQYKSSYKRIDLIIALINAMYVCMKNEGTESIYSTRGIITA